MTRNQPYTGEGGEYSSYQPNSYTDDQNNTPYNGFNGLGLGAAPQPPPGARQPQHIPYSARYQQEYPPDEMTAAPNFPVYGRPSEQEEEYAPPPGPPPGHHAEGDRGVMGAMAGGAAGAFAGHKVHHGFLGGLGGAVAGSMLEDAYKKHEREKHDAEHRRHELEAAARHHQHDQHHHHDAPPLMAGNFLASARNVRLEENHLLVADCKTRNGGHFRSVLDLNDCFTNSWGRLEWARDGNFAASARHIRLVDGGSILEAELGDGNGNWVPNRIWLNEKITNEDGCLRLMD